MSCWTGCARPARASTPCRSGSPLRETFTDDVAGHGRLVKQSGGHGQYAVCDVEVAPLPRGSGVEFAEKVVGGAVPSQFIGSVEKGVRTQLEQGLDSDHIPVVDVLVTLLDGKAHSVDSSDAAFQMAGALAVKDAAREGRRALLEPIATVDITVPDAHVGSVLSDLSGRRGRVTGTEPDPTAPVGMERTVVHAEVPDAELTRYAIVLRSLTAGTGRSAAPVRPLRGRTAARRGPIPRGRQVLTAFRPASGGAGRRPSAQPSRLDRS